LATRRVPRWRHSGGLPGIAPLRLSSKKNGTVAGVGMIRSARPLRRYLTAPDKQPPNRYDEREPRPAAKATGAILADVTGRHSTRSDNRWAE